MDLRLSIMRLCAVAAAMALMLSAAHAEDGERAAAVEAAFLYNFAKFTEWPSGRFHSARDPVVFCLGAGSPIREAVAALEGKPVGMRTVHVMLFAEGADPSACHLLFVDASVPAGIRQGLAAHALRGVLTVSDLPDFALSGGDIGLFYNEKKQLRFQINLENARRNDIAFSSKLLQLADIIGRSSLWRDFPVLLAEDRLFLVVFGRRS